MPARCGPPAPTRSRTSRASSSVPAVQRASSAQARAAGRRAGLPATTVCPAAAQQVARSRGRRRPSARRAASAASAPRSTPPPAAAPGVTRRRARARSASTESISAASSTVVASGPFSAMPNHEPLPRSAGTTPCPGLMPTSPQQAAGMRIEPMPSLPCAIGTVPDATAAAEPPDEPPGRARAVPRVAGDAERRVGGAEDASSGTRVMPDDDRAGRPQPAHDLVVARLRRRGRWPRSRCASARRHRRRCP